MKLNKYLYYFCFITCFALTSKNGFAQLAIVGSYSGCPNQVVTITASWPNTAINSWTLTTPAGALPASGPIPIGPGLTFTIVHSSTVAGCFTFTLSASGSGGSGAVTNSVTFNYCIVLPPTVTFSNPQYDYCPGGTATIDATSGAFSYAVSGPGGFNQVYTNNLITISPIAAVHNGTYLITSIGTCTSTGIFTINVAPATPVAVNASSNICLGQAFSLTAVMPSGFDYQWYDPLGAPIFTALPLPSTNGNYTAYPTSDGTYTMIALLPFNSTTCPRSAVTTVSVVQTGIISATASPAGIVCENDKINFNAGASPNPFGWSWAGPQSFFSSIANPVINPAKPNNSGDYTVTALFTNNVITCTTKKTVSVSVIAVNQPAITMPNSVCQAANVSFTASANTAIGWQWSGPNGFSANTAVSNFTNAQPNASGIYYVTAKFQLGSYTCAATNSAQLNVVPVNSVSAIPPAPVCMPGNGYLQASAIGAYQYSWVGPNNFSAPSSNPIVYYPTPSATGVYTVTAYFSGGNIVCSNTNTVQLTVNPILTFSLNPRQRACYNTPINIIGPTGATSYSWTSSNGFTSNQKDINFASIQPKDAGTYTLNISLGPCITSGSTTIDVVTPISFTLNPLSRTVCNGDTTYAEVGVSGGSENNAFDWNPSIYFTDDQRGPKKIIVPKASTYYNITAYDIACPNYTILTSFSLNVNQPPKPDLILPKNRACEPFEQIYNPKTQKEAFVTTLDFGGLLEYQIRDTDTLGIKVKLDKPGTYPLTIYTKGKKEFGGCTGVFEYPYPIIVDPKPGSDIIWNPENPTTNDEITFTPTNKAGPIDKRFWMFAGGEPTIIDTSIKVVPGSDTSNVLNPIRKYKTLGKYPIMLSSRTEVGCTDTILRFMIVSDDFKVYVPNSFTPNEDGLNDVFIVKGSGIKSEGFSMDLSDRWGNTVFSSRDISVGWDGKVGGRYAEVGTYIYRIRVVSTNGEGRKEFVGYFSVIK